MYKLICMSFDGGYQTESPVFDTVSHAWNYSNNLGSKWFFFPFHFVTSESGMTIKDSPDGMEQFNGMRVVTVARIFKAASELPELQQADCDTFAAYLYGMMVEPMTQPTTKEIKQRLEYLRGEINAERISYEEITELQALAEYIDPGDAQLLEWAGIPENAEGL